MATLDGARFGSSVLAGRDRIVRRLDEFPELNKALRTGDVPTGRYICSQLFNLEARQELSRALQAKAS